MNTRTKIAASGFLVAALAATATPAFAHDNGNRGTASGTAVVKQHAGHLASLVTAGTITQAQADAVETATRTALGAAKTAKRNAGLAALVANNTITQAMADAAKATAADATGKPGRPDLSSWTVAQRDALRAWRDANPVDAVAVRAAALAKLVTAGTITQTQSDAIAAAYAAAPTKGADGGKGHHGKGGKGRGGHDSGAAIGVTPLAGTTTSA